MWNVEFASGVRSVATGGWSVHGVDCNVCSVWFSLVVFSMLNVKCNVGRFVPNVRCGVCSVKWMDGWMDGWKDGWMDRMDR